MTSPTSTPASTPAPGAATPAHTRLDLPGLRDRAEIRIDRWGVPHIRAGSAHDAFFLQGFNAARDRLFQIDLWRKRGLGLLAADFGPGYLAQDRASRLFLYRGAIAAEYAHYGHDAEAICTAFAAGINAAIDAIEAGDLPLPEAFSRLGTRPAKWSPEDVVRIRIHALAGNALSEFHRYRLMKVLGPEDGAIADQLRAPLSHDLAPAHWKPMAHADLPDEAMDLYRLAIAPVTFAPERLRATLDQAGDWAKTKGGKVVQTAARYSGSNNWAVAASHTATGRPLMASDPHRVLGAPSIRYLVHLSTPDFDVIGAGEPSSPGVMAGHNGHAAFSMTYFAADQEDLMVLALTEGGYFHEDGVAPLTEIDEAIPVRGAPDQPVTLCFAADNAPVLWRDDQHALALRTTFTEPGTAPYMACLASMRARNPEAFCQALEGWGAPGSNQVYADVSGGLLWQVAARVPRRQSGHGVVPVPGDGRAAWNGFMNASDLPGISHPQRGFVNSSNEMNLPADWDNHAHPVGFEWHRDGRAERVAEVLAAAPTDVAASCALQTDVHNRIALRLIASLPADGHDAGTAPAAALLHGWDGMMQPDSGAALIYAFWSARHLYPALIARLPEAARPLIDEVEETAVAEIFEGSRAGLARLLGLGDPAARRALLIETLAEAIADCATEHGADPAGWAWGKAHQARFIPPAGGAGTGPLPVGGGNATVMMQAYEAPGFQTLVGASVRMVVDVGAWDESRWINSPGQSGDAASPHGGDLAPIWAAADYVPMPYSRAAVDAVTEAIWDLSPKG